jgi:glycosyltransferase involved in cell wall biosynthesis
MKLSVIIPTFNRADKLIRTLDALQHQTFNDFEMVVVVDGSTDNTLSLLDKVRPDFGSITIVPLPNSGRAIARNRGAAAASGDLLIFIDDDICLQTDAVERHRNLHLNQPGKIIFGHLELTSTPGSKDDFLTYRRTVEASWGKHQQSEISLQQFAFTSANLSMSKSIFNSLQGFDPTLRDSEDFDFGIRALLLGIPIHYEKAIKGYHDDIVDLPHYVARHREYYSSKVTLLQKHPNYRTLLPEQFQWMRHRTGDGWKKLLFSEPDRWVTIFSSKLFLLFPTSLRARLYSTFVYTQSVLRRRP